MLTVEVFGRTLLGSAHAKQRLLHRYQGWSSESRRERDRSDDTAQLGTWEKPDRQLLETMPGLPWQPVKGQFADVVPHRVRVEIPVTGPGIKSQS
eukprot:4631886-Amphidinium_carterae.1